ncbi:MAG: phosphate/phosphite/phosphonate ABC transporter substrate-binding protein [Holophagaceae bacterium]|nr:phosphate/phosphite/phosphonate ABC transporter substrate-binding protein [Holophagaceae bacterium]
MHVSGRWMRLGLLLAALAVTSWAAEPRFIIGVAPHTSARVILENYAPLRRHIEAGLGLPTEVATAKDFTEFVRQARAQQFDLVITTGHQARLLQVDSGYTPLLTYRADFRSVVIVPKDSPVHSANDLKGGGVIGLSPTSLVTLWGQHWLRRSLGSDVHVRYVSAADSVAQILLAGEAKAGLVSLANFQGLAEEVRSRLRVLVESEPMAGRVYVLNQRQKHRRRQIEAALWSFEKTEEGKRYFAALQLGGYRTLRRGELERMDPFAEEVRKVLVQP